jgi:hypothetical protein
MMFLQTPVGTSVAGNLAENLSMLKDDLTTRILLLLS